MTFSCVVSPPRVTVKVKSVVPVLPSLLLTSLIENVGGPSSLVIVPTPVPVSMMALTGFERLTSNASSSSSATSPFTFTVTVLLVWPAVKVSVVAVIAV